MDQATYTRLLHARIEHVEGALRRSLGQDIGDAASGHLDELRSHAAKAEAAGEDWTHHRAAVEHSFEQLTRDIDSHGSTSAEVAEAIRDGAVDLFRGEPLEILATANAILERARETSGN